MQFAKDDEMDRKIGKWRNAVRAVGWACQPTTMLTGIDYSLYFNNISPYGRMVG